ncbi:MAG TPA: glycogen-binding domain-containing protein [Chitinophagaceae bacterium]|nr:glycogen-binding domain-containing protein [Chitinophagaceae bacterium]
MKAHISPQINLKKNTIGFFVKNSCANHISLAGSFNHWAQGLQLTKLDEDGIWGVEIPMLPQGKYKYKFFIDDKMWMEDIDNPLREPDGVNGWNSILTIDK